MATFYNQATLSYNGNVTGSNITTGEIVEVITANKSAVSDNYTAAGDNTYVINIINSGNTDVTGLTVTDDLGSYTVGDPPTAVVPLDYVPNTVNYYVNGVKQADPTVSSESPLTVEGISVPSRGNAAIVYTARTNGFAPLGENGSITNTASISGAGLINPVTAAATVDHSQSPVLTINKALEPSVVPENGTITYTFNIQNYGAAPAEASDNVEFRDDFSPILNISSVTFNNTPWTAGTDYSYNTATGAFRSETGKITVPAATYTQDPKTGAWSATPGTSTLVITGTISAAAPPATPPAVSPSASA